MTSRYFVRCRWRSIELVGVERREGIEGLVKAQEEGGLSRWVLDSVLLFMRTK